MFSIRTPALSGLVVWSLAAAVPTGWSLAGTNPQGYDCSIDPTASYNGQPSTYLKSKGAQATNRFGTMMQSFSAAPYAGKRLRFSANLKSENVEVSGGLWMRVDDDVHLDPKTGKATPLAFDNMHDRPIKGTTIWRNYSVVLDAPERATTIYIGLLLDGSGALWINGIKLEVVGPDVPVTDKPTAPVNLGFEK